MRLFETVLRSLAPSEGNWQCYCVVTSLKKNQKTKQPPPQKKPQQTKNPTKTPPKEPITAKPIFQDLYLYFQCSLNVTWEYTTIKITETVSEEVRKLLNINCYRIFRRDLQTVAVFRICIFFNILRIMRIKKVVGPMEVPSERFMKLCERGQLDTTVLS